MFQEHPSAAIEPPVAPWRTLAPLAAARRGTAIAAALVVLAGVALRMLPCFGVPDNLSLDERLYIRNVRLLEEAGGLMNYPLLVGGFVQAQRKASYVMLPPTRAFYITAGWAWNEAFHSGYQMSLRYVAGIFSTLGFLVAMTFAWRLGGAAMGLVTGALMAVSPLQLMLAHRELVDGVFSFWAVLSLWLLWENLHREPRMAWLAAYAGALAMMVLTKENAFFAAVGIGGLIGAAFFFPGLGRVRRSTVAATGIGGLLGIGMLISLAGGLGTLVEAYRLVVMKAEAMQFAYESGGGPWYRYIIDLMLISPLVMLPAIGAVFTLRRESRGEIFGLLFILFSGLVMVNVKNGMDVRYAAMWEMPLRYLAASVILRLAGASRRAPVAMAAALVACVGAVELHQYWLLFVRHDIVDPITQYLMYATEIVRVGKPH